VKQTWARALTTADSLCVSCQVPILSVCAVLSKAISLDSRGRRTTIAGEGGLVQRDSI